MLETVKSILKKVVKMITACVWNVSEKDLNQGYIWVDRLYRGYIFLLKIVPEYPFSFFFSEYKSSINSWFLRNPSNKEHLSNYLCVHYNEVDDREKMFIHCIASSCGVLDESFTKMIIEDLINTRDQGYRYWGALDISYSTFVAGQGVYPDYYKDRRRLFQLISDESNIVVPTKEEKDNRLKLCIIAYLLDPDMHNSLQRVCTMFANNLVHFVDEVMVLCTDSTYRTRGECKSFITWMRTKESDIDADGVCSKFTKGVTVRFAQGDSYIARAQNSIDILYDFNPSIVIDLCDDYSPFSYLYARDFFTVYEPMRVGVSSQCFEKIIASPFKFDAVNNQYNKVLKKEQALYWLFPEFVPESTNDMTKKSIGISNNSFIVITIGNNSALSNELIDAMRLLLDKETDIIWLLVGTSGPDYLRFTCKELLESRQIIEWGFENNLRGLCAACDVVLRPDITGGSGGTAIAAMEGLPVVMTSKVCDPSRWLGLDYSAIENEAGLVNEIISLKTDKVYYTKRQILVKKLVGEAVDSKDKWKKLFDLMIMAEQEWSQSNNE